MPIMTDGFSTTIQFPDAAGAIAGVLFKEKTVKPFGLDSRGPIDTTSMRNLALVTKVPKKLIDVTQMTLTVQWDPAIYGTLLNVTGIMRINQRVYVRFPNSEIWSIYGWCDKFDPQDNTEGEVPMANMTIEVSNLNGNGIETYPVRIQ